MDNKTNALENENGNSSLDQNGKSLTHVVIFIIAVVVDAAYNGLILTSRRGKVIVNIDKLTN